MSTPGQPATDAGQEERLIGSVPGMLDESLDPQPDLRQPQHLELLVLGRDGIAAPLAALALPVPGAVVAPSRPRRSRPMPAGPVGPEDEHLVDRRSGTVRMEQQPRLARLGRVRLRELV